MKILGLDVGEKRIGVARVDTSTRIAVPCGTINVDGSEWEQLGHLAKIYDTNLFVLGLPRSNEGNETAQSLYVRNFAKTLVEKIPNAHIRFQDESLTSVEAEKRLKARKKPYQKSEIDTESATIILQDFIENFNEKPTEVKKTVNVLKKTADKTMLKTKTATTKSKNLYKKLIPIPISLFLIILITLGGILWYRTSLNPVIKNCNNNQCPDHSFIINEGASIDAIANDLKTANLIQSAFFFKAFIKISHQNDTLKSGEYTLNQGLSAYQIADILIAGSKSSDVFSFTILPGETLFTIAKKLQNIGYSPEEIHQALYETTYESPIFADKPSDKSIEGYLFGETYEFYRNTTAQDIIKTFISGMETIVSKNQLQERFLEQGLSIYEGIVLASIVEKEAYSPNYIAEQPTVAQIFLSRLKIGKHLGSDATIKYDLERLDPGREIYPTVGQQIAIESCYNTSELYGHAGLPCGAISNPSLSALLAVANPAETNYLYFLTGDDNRMYYGETENDHNQNITEHCQKLCNESL